MNAPQHKQPVSICHTRARNAALDKARPPPLRHPNPPPSGGPQGHDALRELVAHANLTRDLALAEKYRRARPGQRAVAAGGGGSQVEGRVGGEEERQAVTISTIHAAKVCARGCETAPVPALVGVASRCPGPARSQAAPLIP